MSKKTQEILLLTIITIASTILLWLPFSLNLPNVFGIAIPESGFQTVQRNYDGLNYIIVAKSFYSKEIIGQFPQELPSEYFAAHFPGFPLVIQFFGPFFGYLNGMLLTTLLFSCTAVVAFYLLLKELGFTRNALWLSTLFLFLPARWLIVRSVGTPEPMFITFVLLSFLFFVRALRSNKVNRFLYSGIFGAFAMLTRSPGVLLFAAYGLYLLWEAYQESRQARVILNTFDRFDKLTAGKLSADSAERNEALPALTAVRQVGRQESSKVGITIEVENSSSSFLRMTDEKTQDDNKKSSNKNVEFGNIFRSFRWNSYPLLLIPLMLIGIFYLYSIVFNDFFAYFHSGDNIHLSFPPFQVFNSAQYWVGDFWLEDIIFYFLIYGSALFILWKKKLYHFAFFAGVFLLATISVAHRDIARYSLPIAPFAIIAFEDFLSRKEFKIVMALVALGIYLYAINFIVGNTFPVVNLAPYQ